MDEDVCGSGIIWKILRDVPLNDVVLSVQYWDYHQVVL